MESGICFNLQPRTNIVIDLSPTDSKPGVAAEVMKTFLKVILGEGQIPIELDDELPVIALDCAVSVIKCFDDPTSRFSKSPVAPVYDTDPREPNRMLFE